METVAPRYALFSVGYRNRFGHPRGEVLVRYRSAGSALLRTDTAGAVEMRFARGSSRVEARARASLLARVLSGYTPGRRNPP